MDNFTKQLWFAVKIILNCSKKTCNVNVDKLLHTLLHMHPKILEHVGTKEQFLDTYKCNHMLENVPPPFITELPLTINVNNMDADSSTTITLPPP